MNRLISLRREFLLRSAQMGAFHRTGKTMRRLLLLALLFFAGGPTWAQTYYVFMYNNNGTFNFLANVNNNPTLDNVQNNFSYETCVWTFNSNSLYNAYTASTRYLMYYNSSDYNYIVKNATNGNGNQYKWTITRNATTNTVRNNNQTSRYIRFNGTGWELTTTNSKYRCL